MFSRKWGYTINIKPYLNQDVTEWGPECENARDSIVALLTKCRDYNNDYELRQIVEEMDDCDDLEWFNQVLDALYNWADENSVWMGL